MDARIPRHHRLPGGAARELRSVAVTLVVLALAGAGCTVDSVVAGAGVPGTTLDAQVGAVAERGSYLDAVVDAGGFDYRFFFPNEPRCRALLESPAGARYQWLGLMGRLSRGEERCDAVGVLSLAAWRDRQPRRSREPLPRSPARYQVVYEDADLVQLEGRFPLARQLGFMGTGQLIAVIPNDPACRGFGDRGTASMEYRVSGPHPLVLINRDELCPVLGLAQPPPQTGYRS